MNQLEREEEQLERDLEAGRITQSEFNKEMRELRYSYRASAERAAQDAYDNEMERW